MRRSIKVHISVRVGRYVPRGKNDQLACFSVIRRVVHWIIPPVHGLLHHSAGKGGRGVEMTHRSRARKVASHREKNKDMGIDTSVGTVCVPNVVRGGKKNKKTRKMPLYTTRDGP